MPSVPLTDCSMTCATVSLTTEALAPTYVVETLMVGGEIRGYWATGSESPANTPMMTNAIAMTMAKIGRRIKNFGKINSSFEDRYCL